MVDLFKLIRKGISFVDITGSALSIADPGLTPNRAKPELSNIFLLEILIFCIRFRYKNHNSLIHIFLKLIGALSSP